MPRVKQGIVAILLQKRDFQECFERAKGYTDPDGHCHRYFSQRDVSTAVRSWGLGWAISKDWAFPNPKWMLPALAPQSFRQTLIYALVPRTESVHQRASRSPQARTSVSPGGEMASVCRLQLSGDLGCIA